MMFLLAFVSSALACLLIVRSNRLHFRVTADIPGAQAQKFHTMLVPRVGGIAVFVGVLSAGLLLPLSGVEVNRYWMLMWSLMPAFFGGFAEDVTRRVGAGSRLLLTLLTAACAYGLAGVQFVRSDMAWLDTALAFAPFGYAALLFAVAGVAHAINLIDGYNGLASGFALVTLTAMGYVAGIHGDGLVTALCYSTAGATLGFLLFNYPSGRIFLGDGGAYLLGCVIALASALLVLRDRQVSPWFPMALVTYPVWETLFSIGRRVFHRQRRIWEPDARHMHSLLYRRAARKWVRGRRQADGVLRNSLTAIPFVLGCAVVAGIAVMAHGETRILQALIVWIIAAYCVGYWRLLPTWRRRGRQATADALPAVPAATQGLPPTS